MTRATIVTNHHKDYVGRRDIRYIKKTIDSLQWGEMPLTVAQSQSLDKIWGQAARGADGSTAYAINQARRLLADAPISDEIGLESKQA